MIGREVLNQFFKNIDKENVIHTEASIYFEVLEAIHDGIFIADSNGCILYVNESFMRLSGFDKVDFNFKTVYEIVDSKLTSSACTISVLETGQPKSIIVDYYKGSKCLVSGTPVFKNDELIAVVSIVRDLTELNMLEELLEDANSLAQGYQEKLKEIATKSTNQYVSKTRNKEMTKIYNKAIKVSTFDTPVLILGETGTGKDFLAKFIHEIDDIEGNFIKINCGAIPANLLESELFGYEAGAFTGARKNGKAGLFELANKGTLFLDEIGDLPLELQVKLLSAIQDKVIYRLGGTKAINLETRIIAATNVKIDKLINEGKFRRDLYYRLNVVELCLLPLRDRPEDISQLALQFLDEFNKKHDKAKYFTPHVIELLSNYHWPGNIRELKNIVEKIVIFSENNKIQPNDLESKFLVSTANLTFGTCGLSLKNRLNKIEKDIIKEELSYHSTLKDASVSLGIDISTLVRKKRKYKL